MAQLRGIARTLLEVRAAARIIGGMHSFDATLADLSHDPIHGYIAFTSQPREPGEVCERQLIDDPWLQRLRQIHQLQTAWWVFPTAEHSRFQHVLGVMHLASRVIRSLYGSLAKCDPELPSPGYVESLLRLAGLLHDVGHGPFGHFFDEHYLQRWGLTHEVLGGEIIRSQLADKIRRVRGTPWQRLEPDETLDPAEVAWLIQRPRANEDPAERPRWLRLLRSLLSGIYTIDNLDFVLRDAYMTGYSQRAFDLDRLLHYSFFTPQGLTIHERGLDALLRFLGVRAELFRTIYFHRTVRSIDLTLADLFDASRDLLFPGNPLEHLDAYRRFTEQSLLVDVARWSMEDDSRKRALGERWDRLLRRELDWKMVCQRSQLFSERDAERSSILTDPAYVEQRLREQLAATCGELELRVDIARHIHRPHTRGAASGQNFLYDAASDSVRPLNSHALFQRLPVSHRICRVYTRSADCASAVAEALDSLLGTSSDDDLTNM